MNAQQITGRLLQSLSADKSVLIDSYLLAFGVTKVGLYTLPSVFKPIYDLEWNAFNKAFQMDVKGGPAKKHLYRILEFVRYMQAIGFNPFAKTLKHPRQTKLSSSARFKSIMVYEKLIETSFSAHVDTIKEMLRKYQLSVVLKSKKTVSQIIHGDGTYRIVVSQVLVPARKNAVLDAVITGMQGTLYNDSSAPTPLRERKQPLPKESRLKPKVLNLKADALIKDRSFLGWYPLRRTSSFNASIVRAKDDCLVLKIVIHLDDLDIDLGVSAKATLSKLWKNVSKTI